MPPRNPVQPTRAIQATEPTTLLNLLRAGGEAEAQGIRQQAAPWVEAVGTAIPQAGAAISAGLKEHRERPMREEQAAADLAYRKAQTSGLEAQAAERLGETVTARDKANKARILNQAVSKYTSDNGIDAANVIQALSSQGWGAEDLAGAAQTMGEINKVIKAVAEPTNSIQAALSIAALGAGDGGDTAATRRVMELRALQPEAMEGWPTDEEMAADPTVARRFANAEIAVADIPSEQLSAARWLAGMGQGGDNSKDRYLSMQVRSWHNNNPETPPPDGLRVPEMNIRNAGVAASEYAYRKWAAIQPQALNAANTQARTDENAKDIAQAMCRGDYVPTIAGLRGGTPAAVAATISRMMRDDFEECAQFNFAEAQTDWNAMQAYMRGLNGGPQIRLRQAISFAYESLPLVEKWAEAWNPKRWRTYNEFRNAVAFEGLLGREAQMTAMALDMLLADMQTELAVVYRGGGTPTMELARHNLQINMSKDVLMQNVEVLRDLLNVRARSVFRGGLATIPNSYMKHITGMEVAERDGHTQTDDDGRPLVAGDPDQSGEHWQSSMYNRYGSGGESNPIPRLSLSPTTMVDGQEMAKPWMAPRAYMQERQGGRAFHEIDPQLSTPEVNEAFMQDYENRANLSNFGMGTSQPATGAAQAAETGGGTTDWLKLFRRRR